MSNPFVVDNYFKFLPNQLKILGDGSVKSQIFGQDARGYEATRIDFSKALGSAWATGDLAMILVAVPCGSILPQSMQTQSHAFGTFIQGSVTFELYMEGINMAVNTSIAAQIKFEQDVIHALRGMNGSPVTLFLTQSPAAEPTVLGFNGAVATVGNQVAVLAPYGIAAPGGI